MTKANVKGIVIGNGPNLELLKRDYPNIEFTGWLNKNEMEKYYLKAKAVIIPSRWYEGASLIPMEAAKYNVTCITSATCAAKQFVPKENIYSNIEELINIKSTYYEELIEFYQKMIMEVNEND